jgi:hypothetical protein
MTKTRETAHEDQQLAFNRAMRFRHEHEQEFDCLHIEPCLCDAKPRVQVWFTVELAGQGVEQGLREVDEMVKARFSASGTAGGM